MRTDRRVGRYTKHENAELIRMFGEDYSVYKICRNLNRSQKSIRNNLIRLNLIEGEITPRQNRSKVQSIEINDSLTRIALNYFFYLVFLTILTFIMLIKPILNPVEMFIEGILIILLWYAICWSSDMTFKSKWIFGDTIRRKGLK